MEVNLVNLLFLVYISDLCIVCKSTEPVLFADDTPPVFKWL